jgi:anhydro-N-acetylmuramic acid kinase
MAAVRAIGMMSGTSLDGVDVALIETDGERVAGFGPTSYRPYAETERAVLRQALKEATKLTDRNARAGAIGQAQDVVTQAHAQALEQFLTQHRLSRLDIAVVGFHGQTVLHRPDQRLTVQIGDATGLATRIGMLVAFDFRAADVAAGGQGAPLVPVYHRALVDSLPGKRPVAVLNIGGVANLTFCDEGQPPIACDTGPGNALIDDFMRARAGRSHDEGGATAASGKVHLDVVHDVLREPFFDQPPPKSVDRNAFAPVNAQLAGLSLADGAATLTALTAMSIARTVAHLPRPPARWIVAGGGANNRTILTMLAEHLAPAAVETAGAVGWSADALEAQAFAHLAVRTLRGLPLTFPSTTGVAAPMPGGLVTQPAR